MARIQRTDTSEGVGFRPMMASWPALPDVRVTANGPSSAAILAVGCRTYRSAARHLCELPYGRNSDRADYRLVLSEGRGTCSTKHALLAAIAGELGLPIALTIGIYDLCEANTPGVGGVLARHRLDAIPEAHCYLRSGGRRIDVTRSDASAAEPISEFHREWTIVPAQIGEHKVELHREYLRRWLADRSDVSLSEADLWRVREDCIAAIAARESESGDR